MIYCNKGPSWPWSHVSWNYNYLCNQYLQRLLLWVRISNRARSTTICDKVGSWLATDLLFSPDTPVSSTNKTDRHDIPEILLKAGFNNNHSLTPIIKDAIIISFFHSQDPLCNIILNGTYALHARYVLFMGNDNKGKNKITEIRTILQIRVITKLPNSEQSYKGKVKTHNYINRQNQSTTGKLWKP